jgi:hypothetical protein
LHNKTVSNSLSIGGCIYSRKWGSAVCVWRGSKARYAGPGNSRATIVCQILERRRGRIGGVRDIGPHPNPLPWGEGTKQFRQRPAAEGHAETLDTPPDHREVRIGPTGQAFAGKNGWPVGPTIANGCHCLPGRCPGLGERLPRWGTKYSDCHPKRLLRQTPFTPNAFHATLGNRPNPPLHRWR